MKRLMVLILTVLLLGGCAGESLTIDPLDKDRDFGAFHAAAPSVEEANRAYALVQDALGCYPEGFAEQWGRVNILLVSSLTGEEQFAHGQFAGFTQRTEDGWEIFYEIPASFVQLFIPDFALTPGKVLRANCYKCGDLTVQEHYMSWNPVEVVDPDFHVPAFFGKMILG